MISDPILANCYRRTLTREWQSRVARAKQDIERWLHLCQRPAVSVSGGKDSTALLHLVRSVRPDVLAIRADPPNPLPERAEHVAALHVVSGGPWEVVEYPWDVDAVLRGDIRYPENLKIRVLQALHRRLGLDGLALGIRASESSQRRKTLHSRGTVYQLADHSWRCCPLAWWTALDVIGYLLRQQDYPLNPVYTHTRRMPEANLEHLRDGTWWPHGLYPEQIRPWLEMHYSECVPLFDAACRVGVASFMDSD